MHHSTSRRLMETMFVMAEEHADEPGESAEKTWQ
jgi:hypothetical protein